MHNEGSRVTPHTPCQSLAPFEWGSMFHWCQNELPSIPWSSKFRLWWNCFTAIKHPDRGDREWHSPFPLMLGIVGPQLPLLRAPRDVTIARARVSLRVPRSQFRCRILTFVGWNYKSHVIIVIKTGLSWFALLGRAKSVSNASSYGYCIGTSSFSLQQCDNNPQPPPHPQPVSIP